MDYLLITFTVPSPFRSLFRSGQELCYDTLFKTAAAVLNLLQDNRPATAMVP